MSVYAKTCIKCPEKPLTWVGHFHRKDEKIIAGFCGKHRKESYVNTSRHKCEGCYGKEPEKK